MEVALALELISTQIIDIAVEEMIITVLGSKCCLYSKKKWKKVRTYMNKDKHERALRIAEKLANQQITDFAIRIDEKKTIKSTFV
tara:strand:+ start:570 stop:824 length:255 start_codon:yes stop_codon:yes gene_type:complete